MTKNKKGFASSIVAAIAATTFAAGAWAQDVDDGGFCLGGVGEFQADINPAFELAYLNLGGPEDEVMPDRFVEIESDGFAPYIVGTLPFAAFELFANAGYLVYESEARISSPIRF